MVRRLARRQRTINRDPSAELRSRPSKTGRKVTRDIARGCMNILMMSNTYKPLVGGLEKSIESFTKSFRGEGHRVIVVAPEFANIKEEEDVIRILLFFHIQLPVP